VVVVEAVVVVGGGKAKANGFGGATSGTVGVGNVPEWTVEDPAAEKLAEGRTASLEVTRSGTAVADWRGEPAKKGNCPPDVEEAARDATGGKESSGRGVVEEKLTAVDGAVKIGTWAAGPGKDGLPPLTTEANVGATPAVMRAEREGVAAEKNDEANGTEAMRVFDGVEGARELTAEEGTKSAGATQGAEPEDEKA
jgi:hypothetical protein